MKNTTLTVAFLCLFTSGLFAQWQWLSPGHFNGININKGVAVDQNGGVYTTGSHALYPTEGSITLRKYAPNGNTLYEKKIATVYNTDPALCGNDIAVNLDRNTVVIGGYETATAYLGFFRADNGTPILPKIAFSSIGSAEISKIDVRGDHVWVIGNFQSALTLGNSAPTYTGNPMFSGKAFIAKYSLVTGACISSVFLESSYLLSHDIKVDDLGNVYCTVRNHDRLLVHSSPYYTYVPNNTTGAEVLLIKLTPSFQVAWIKPLAVSNYGDPEANHCPIALAPDLLSKHAVKVVVGGYDWNTESGFLNVVNGENGQLANQIGNIPFKTINDIAISNCQPQCFYVTGADKTSGYRMYQEKYALGNLSVLGSEMAASTGLSVGHAIAMEGGYNPVFTGHYKNGSFFVGGLSLGTQTYYSTMTGLFRDPASCCNNRGLVLDGVDDYLGLTGMPLSGNPAFTFEAWVFSTATNTGNCNGKMRRLLGWGVWGGHQIEIGECSGNLMVNYYSFVTTQIATNAWLRGGWHHVAVVRSKNPDQLTVYVDGQWVDSKPVPSINISWAGSFMIGRATSAMNGVENWRGRLDEVRLWDRARSQSEIVNEKDCMLAGNEPGLKLYFPLDHGVPFGQNAGASVAWNYATNNNLYANLRNFTLNGSLSNWICTSTTGLPVSGVCSPFAPDPELDERAEDETNLETPKTENGVLRLFPNPTQGLLNLQLGAPALAGTTIRIADLTGRLALEAKAEVGSEQQQVQAGDLAKGVYFLQVVAEGKVLAVEKFVKH